VDKFSTFSTLSTFYIAGYIAGYKIFTCFSQQAIYPQLDVDKFSTFSTLSTFYIAGYIAGYKTIHIFFIYISVIHKNGG